MVRLDDDVTISCSYLVGGFLPDVLAEYIDTQNAWIMQGHGHASNETEYWTHAALLLNQGASSCSSFGVSMTAYVSPWRV